MKKIIVLMMCMVILPVYATKMCAVNNSVAVVLDPTIVPSSYTSDNARGTWSDTFSFGKISGISACLNSKQGKSQGGWVERLTDTDNNGNTNLVVGSEKYGRYCWCKMTHPAASRWVFYFDSGSASSCASNCAYYCGRHGQDYASLRVGLFGSVASN